MDFLLEIIFEIVMEGSLELGTSRKVPLPLRILAVIVLAVSYGGLALILGVVTVDCWLSEDYLVSVLVAAILIGFTLMCVFGIRKKLKERR